MGRRVGTKRSDRRWEDDEGHVWASELEYRVFTALAGEPGVLVERCEQGGRHTFRYTSPVRSGKCATCGSNEVVQERTYTPDLFVRPKGSGGDKRGYYIEVKGYFPAARRTLLRCVLKANPGVDLRFILHADRTATRRLTVGEYITKYMKCQWHVWDGRLPRSWT